MALHDGKAYVTGSRGVVEVEPSPSPTSSPRPPAFPTDGYSLYYVAHWSAGDTDVVRSTAERVIGCARRIVADLGLAEPDVPAA